MAVDDLSNYCEFKTLKITTRQAFQLHGILKSNLKNTIRTVNGLAFLTTLAACGDVNRNVMCNPNPLQTKVHGEVQGTEAVDIASKATDCSLRVKFGSMEKRSFHMVKRR